MSAYVLGIDVSTTATKALLIDGRGKSSRWPPPNIPSTRPIPCGASRTRPSGGRGDQQHPQVLAKAASRGGHRRRRPDRPNARPGAARRSGRVLRPSILWNDQRTAAQCDEIRPRGQERADPLTGNDALTGFTAPKMLWVRDHEPEILRDAAKFLLPKDYLRYRLTGEFATDNAGAAGTLLLDLRTRDWSPEVLEQLDIPAELSRPPMKARKSPGRFPPRPPQATGLAAGTPVVAGGGDQAAGAVGVGAVQRGHRLADVGHLRRRLCHGRTSRSTSRRDGCTPSVMPCRAVGTSWA